MFKSIKQRFTPKDELRITFQGNLLKTISLKSVRLSPEEPYQTIVVYRTGEFKPVHNDSYDDWKEGEKVDPVYLNLFLPLIPVIATLFQIREQLSVNTLKASNALAKLENEKRDQLANQEVALRNEILHTLHCAFLRLEKELLSYRNPEDFSQRIQDAFSQLHDTNQLLQVFDEMDLLPPK